MTYLATVSSHLLSLFAPKQTRLVSPLSPAASISLSFCGLRGCDVVYHEGLLFSHAPCLVLVQTGALGVDAKLALTTNHRAR